MAATMFELGWVGLGAVHFSWGWQFISDLVAAYSWYALRHRSEKTFANTVPTLKIFSQIELEGQVCPL